MRIMRKNSVLRKYMSSILLFLLFGTVAIMLWIAKDNLLWKYADWRFLVLFVSGCFWGSNNSLCGGKDFRPFAFWAGMVWLGLLDGYGTGFSALQTAEKAQKGKAGHSALRDVCSIPGNGFWLVFDENHKSGDNYVLDVPCRKRTLLYCGYYVSFYIQR